MGFGEQPLVKEINTLARVSNSETNVREFEVSSQAKRVANTQTSPVLDPEDSTRSLKPMSTIIAPTSTGSFDLEVNSRYRFIGNADANIVLGAGAVHNADSEDFFIPAREQLIITTHHIWNRIDIYSEEGGTFQVVKVG